MYKLKFSTNFVREYKKLVKLRRVTEATVQSVLTIIKYDPYDTKLKTHLITGKKSGNAWSSRLTNDLRILWSVDEDQDLTLEIIRIGGHSGKYDVYKK